MKRASVRQPDQTQRILLVLYRLEIKCRRDQRPRVGLFRRGENLLRRPCSTTNPSFITISSLAKARTTLRSWLMNK